MHRGAFLFLLILGCLITVTRADVSKQELQKWVDESPLTLPAPSAKQAGQQTEKQKKFRQTESRSARESFLPPLSK